VPPSLVACSNWRRGREEQSAVSQPVCRPSTSPCPCTSCSGWARRD
jgi:hypothetical protein